MKVLSVSSLTKSYGRVQALRDVTFDVGGGVTGLLGPNGSGKSTLLLCVLGLLPDWRGDVRVLDLDARRQRRLIRTRVGFMPEADVGLPEMTGIRAARHLATLSGLPYSHALRRAHEVLWHVGLGEAIYRNLGEYSFGMRQRFKLAQALVHDPEVLFLDEPLSGLDPAGRDELLALVRDLATNHGKHVIWSSHILPDVQKVADSVAVLHEGRYRGSFALADLEPDHGIFEIEVEGDAERFREALRGRGIEVTTAVESRAAQADLAPRSAFQATLPPGEGVGDLLRLGRLAETRIRRVAPVKEDLGAVFHRLLETDEKAEPNVAHAEGTS